MFLTWHPLKKLGKRESIEPRNPRPDRGFRIRCKTVLTTHSRAPALFRERRGVANRGLTWRPDSFSRGCLPRENLLRSNLSASLRTALGRQPGNGPLQARRREKWATHCLQGHGRCMAEFSWHRTAGAAKQPGGSASVVPSRSRTPNVVVPSSLANIGMAIVLKQWPKFCLEADVVTVTIIPIPYE